jgi:hypothetical protein
MSANRTGAPPARSEGTVHSFWRRLVVQLRKLRELPWIDMI